jgi:transcriptional regulator with XRE-family HTH domain
MSSELKQIIVGPDQKDNHVFSRLMTIYRNRHHFSRAKVAKDVGVSSEYVRLIEQGYRIPAMEMVAKFLEVYSVPYTIGESRLLFDDYSVEFTSRIKSSRKSKDESLFTRDEVIGSIVRLLVTTDDVTLKQIYSVLAEKT